MAHRLRANITFSPYSFDPVEPRPSPAASGGSGVPGIRLPREEIGGSHTWSVATGWPSLNGSISREIMGECHFDQLCLNPACMPHGWL